MEVGFPLFFTHSHFRLYPPPRDPLLTHPSQCKRKRKKMNCEKQNNLIQIYTTLIHITTKKYYKQCCFYSNPWQPFLSYNYALLFLPPNPSPPLSCFISYLSTYQRSHRHQVPIHHEAVLLLVEEHERRMEQRGQRGNDREGERWRC